MTDTRCKICDNPKYNDNWKIIQNKVGYDLYCNKIECQKHYLIDFADRFLEDTKPKNPHKICRQKRRLLEMTQQELADKIGMSQSMIQHFENGRSNVSVGTLEKIVKVLDLTFSRTFSGAELI